MYSSIKPPQPYEVVKTDSLHVVCDGGEGALGHPRIYLEINPDIGQITCPYCSREFIFQTKG